MCVTDDRGRAFEPRPIPQADPGIFKGLLVIWIPLIVGVFGLALFATSLLFISWQSLPSLGLGAGLCIVALYLVRGLPELVGIPPPVTDESLRAEGRCVVCGYSLATIPPEADGCRTCPVCSAAWGARPCDKCGYQLSGVKPKAYVGIVCPECGTIRPPHSKPA